MSLSRIGVHAHYLPDFYRQAFIASGLAKAAAIPEWSETMALETMDRLQVQTSILSISSPGVDFGDAEAAADLVRRVNDEGARLRNAHPKRFGWFASTSLPDVDRAVEQATHALDMLKADGVVIETNHRGMYLGNRHWNPSMPRSTAGRRSCSSIRRHPTAAAAPR